MNRQARFAFGLAWNQGACDADAGQVVGQQQGTVEGQCVQRLARFLLFLKEGLNVRGKNALGGFAFHAQASKPCFHHLQGDGAFADVLLWQINPRQPSGLAVGSGHSVSGALQTRKVQRAPNEFGQSRH